MHVRNYSTTMCMVFEQVVWGSLIPLCLLFVEESKKKKDKKEKDSEKPDTFLEKLIVHLTKNMQVSRHACS